MPDLLSELTGEPWALAGLAFIFGLAAGLLIAGWGKDEEPNRVGDAVLSSAEGGATAHRAGPDLAALDAIASEIGAARDLAADDDAEARELAAELSDLDAAIKRTSGRLKQIARAIGRR
jgi:hypothetical protein